MEIIKNSKMVSLLEAMRAKAYGRPKGFNITSIRFDNDAMDNKFQCRTFMYNKTTAIMSTSTTVPGKFWTLHPMAGLAGCGRVDPGMFEDSHVLGMHGVKFGPSYAHEAWIQCGKLPFRQDVNKNGLIEINEPGGASWTSGFNIHSCVGDLTQFVERNSAGCTVNEFMTVHKAGVAMHKESMSVKIPISHHLTTADEWSGFLNVAPDKVLEWIENLKD